MERISLIKKTRSVAVMHAIRVLARGGVVVFPTETSYGLGADAMNPKAIARIVAVKGRDAQKALSVLMASQTMARRYAILTPGARRLWTHFLPGPLTLVLPSRDHATTWGVRVSSHPFAHALVRGYGKPITATSANVSGNPPLYDPDAILRAFARRRVKPDLLIDAGVLPERPSSTVVDCTGDALRILREGAIPSGDLHV